MILPNRIYYYVNQPQLLGSYCGVGPTYMTVDEVTQVAYNAGFRGDALAKMVALAYCESNFDSSNRTCASNSTAKGLWQIIDSHRGEGYDPSQAYDPQYNAQWAYNIYQMQGYGAWECYGLSSYSNYYNQHKAEIAQIEANLDAGNGIAHQGTDITPDGSSAGDSGQNANPATATDAITLLSIGGVLALAAKLL